MPPTRERRRQTAIVVIIDVFFFSSRRRHTRSLCDWSSDVCSSDLEEDCERLVAAHAERFGGLNVLVNSAGIGIGGRIEDVQAKHVDLQLGVNLRGLILVTRHALPLLKASSGHVINLASIAGTEPTPGLAVYGATKAAVLALTRSLNAEVEGDGVRCTAIAPAFVDTPMASWSGIPPEQMIRPEDCAELVRAVLRLSPYARVPVLVVERVGAAGG